MQSFGMRALVIPQSKSSVSTGNRDFKRPFSPTGRVLVGW
jgi:hypothetical protein